MRKRPFTLLEILLTFSLMAILATVILTGYRRVALLGQESQEIASLVLARKHLQERMSQIFSHMNASLAPAEPTFYTEEEEDGLALHFVFDNGIDPHPLFCHGVKGKLFIEGGHLILETIPLQESPERRREILMKNVSELSYKFLDFADKEQAASDQWPLNKKRVPALVVLRCRQENHDVDFSFFLSAKSEPAIVYYRESQLQ